MDYQDEDDVKHALGIKSWADVPKDKVLKFVAILPQVSKDVALKVAEQLPELRKIATNALSGLERSHKETVDSNEKSQEHVHHAYQDIRDVLKGELKEEDLTFEQKKEIYDLLMETGKEEFAKDSENKRVLDSWLKTAGVVALAALAVCVVLLADKKGIDPA